MQTQRDLAPKHWARWLASILLALATVANAETDNSKTLSNALSALEQRYEARIGVAVREPTKGAHFGYREDERFLMASTFKPFLCAAILKQVENGEASLAEKLQIRKGDILSYAPVTKAQLGHSLSLATLCRAAIDKSDNTAANLLLRRLGGPSALTAFFRSIADTTTRLDRNEPELNTYAPGDPRDTSSPSAMAKSLQALFASNALSTPSKQRLKNWMKDGSVTQDLFRQSAPESWHIYDKSGGGRIATRNVIVMAERPIRPPLFIAIFTDAKSLSWTERTSLVSQISALIIGLLAAPE